MISDPIYDSVEDARIRKVSKSIKAKIKKTAAPRTYSSKLQVTEDGRKKAEEKARKTLARLVKTIDVSF